jgi:hypothetical protein
VKASKSAAALCACPLVAATLLAGACGSQTTTVSSGRAHADTVTNGVVTHRPMRGTGGATVNDESSGRADRGVRTAAGQLNPCTLVTQAQAQAILGRPIETPQEAPQGPTCIYQPHGLKDAITLTVESIDFAKIKPQIRHGARVEVRNHPAYCGDYGQPTTLVPLPGGRVLSVTAPCALSTRFAAAALPRLEF